MTEGTASGSLRSSVLEGRCLAELRLLSRSLRTFHAVLHPGFPLSHPSTCAETPPHSPGERHWRCSNAVVTVLVNGKDFVLPWELLSPRRHAVTVAQPAISPRPAKRDFSPLHFSYFWPLSGLCCQQSGGLVCATAVAWQFVLHCPADSSARISQWCISWCLAKARVQPAPQCSRRTILPKAWPRAPLPCSLCGRHSRPDQFSGGCTTAAGVSEPVY